jgi:hypothetical protein
MSTVEEATNLGIVGVVLGGAALLILIVMIGVWWWSRSDAPRRSSGDDDDDEEDLERGKVRMQTKRPRPLDDRKAAADALLSS